MILGEKPNLDELVHYGTKRHSGRYPWGSGDEPYQRTGDYLARIEELTKDGLSEAQIAEYFGQTTTQFRKEKSLAINTRKDLEYETIMSLKKKGYSNYKIAEMMGLPNESSVRSKIESKDKGKRDLIKGTSDFLKQKIDEHGIIDVGKGVERDLNIKRDRLDLALYDLEMQGYTFYDRQVEQQTNPGQYTTMRVACRKDMTFQEMIKTDLKDIGSVTDYRTSDDGETFQPSFVYPKSMDSKRLQICYAEDGGIEKDGIIELRRGVEDLSLGNARYSQVRILVDGDRYLKGMAVYSDDLPDGVDVRFNTNKTKDVPMRDVLKKIKDDPSNPFGSSIKTEGGQYWYTDKDGNKQLGLINKRSDEGDWEDWSNALPSQFLSKQALPLAKKQLNLAYQTKQDEYDDICSLTNPTVKKKLLEEFADNCDSAAVKLKAAALPGQQYHVIVPMPSMKDTEIYAPNYKDGEKVALIRYPHGGTFEIPVLTVNNKHAMSRKLLGTDVRDAVCINSKVAEQLSGADFDGDTVMVIPTNDKVHITATRKLKDLEGFDPKIQYATHHDKETDMYYDDNGREVKIMKDTQKQMGVISNLITDMTIGGAKEEHLARAVKHSMVVIDAEKHKLDWRKSEIDNDIQELKTLYQRQYDPKTDTWKIGGASTLISRAKSEVTVNKRQGSGYTNVPGKKDRYGKEVYDPTRPEGAKIYKDADDLYYPDRLKKDKNNPDLIRYKLADGKIVSFNKNNKEDYDYYKPVKKKDPDTGEVYFTNKTGDLTYALKKRTQASTRMAETDDARDLISIHNTPMENVYANHANKMKALANNARKELEYTDDIEYSPSANKIYRVEVDSLMARLNEAAKNQPKERLAQRLASSEVDAITKANPNMTKADIKKRRAQELQRAREIVGAERKLIEVSDREWEAIQAGAISKSSLLEILRYTNMDSIREKAMPRSTTKLTTSQISTIKSMLSSERGYTNADIAARLGVSTSTINKIRKEEGI